MGNCVGLNWSSRKCVRFYKSDQILITVILESRHMTNGHSLNNCVFARLSYLNTWYPILGIFCGSFEMKQMIYVARGEILELNEFCLLYFSLCLLSVCSSRWKSSGVITLWNHKQYKLSSLNHIGHSDLLLQYKCN